MAEQNEKLIQLSEKQKTSAVPELNARLNEIELELKHLNARESATNKAFLELAAESRKAAQGQDAQLADTQKSLIEMNNHYKKLSQDYQRLAAGANLLGAKLEQARDELQTKIDSVDVAAMKTAHSLTQEQNQLQQRAGRIEERATQLAEDMDARLTVMQSTLTSVENRLRDEIQEVARQAEQRDEQIIQHVDRFEAEYYQRSREHQDNIKALGTGLDDVNHRLNESVEQLRQGTSDVVADLQQYADNTQAQHARQQAAVATLGGTLRRHFKGFTLVAVLLAITVGVVAYQVNENQVNASNAQAQLKAETTQLKSDIEANAAQQSAEIKALQSTTAELNQAIDGGDTRLDQSLTAQQQEIASLRASVEQLAARNENTDSRLSAILPHRQFGLDNTIHNPQWLADQDANSFVVTVMSTPEKQAMYETALRWSALLDKANLAWIEQQVEGQTEWTLLYGPFAEEDQALQVARFMPVLDIYKRPAAIQIKDLQK